MLEALARTAPGKKGGRLSSSQEFDMRAGLGSWDINTATAVGTAAAVAAATVPHENMA